MRNFIANKETRAGEKEIKKNKKLGSGSGKVKIQYQGRSKDVLSSSIKEKEFIDKHEFDNLKSNANVVELNDDEFLLDEYRSDEEGGVGEVVSKRKAGEISCSTSDEEGGNEFDDSVHEEEKMKVYFCSRTHSQLSQFVKELRKTVFATELRVVCLASRTNFCINEGTSIFILTAKLNMYCYCNLCWNFVPEVLKLRSSARINERCLDLQKNKKSGVSKIKVLCFLSDLSYKKA